MPIPRQDSTAVPTQQKTGLDINKVGTYDGVDIFDVDLNAFQDKPWRKPGADLTDFFNFGFNEDSWKEYCNKQKMIRDEVMMQRHYYEGYHDMYGGPGYPMRPPPGKKDDDDVIQGLADDHDGRHLQYPPDMYGRPPHFPPGPGFDPYGMMPPYFGHPGAYPHGSPPPKDRDRRDRKKDKESHDKDRDRRESRDRPRDRDSHEKESRDRKDHDSHDKEIRDRGEKSHRERRDRDHKSERKSRDSSRERGHEKIKRERGSSRDGSRERHDDR